MPRALKSSERMKLAGYRRLDTCRGARRGRAGRGGGGGGGWAAGG